MQTSFLNHWSNVVQCIFCDSHIWFIDDYVSISCRGLFSVYAYITHVSFQHAPTNYIVSFYHSSAYIPGSGCCDISHTVEFSTTYRENICFSRRFVLKFAFPLFRYIYMFFWLFPFSVCLYSFLLRNICYYNTNILRTRRVEQQQCYPLLSVKDFFFYTDI